MNEVNTLPERLDFDQEQVDAVFAGMVASMNTVQIDLNVKGDKFSAALPQEATNANTNFDGGMSLAEQEALKYDVAGKFDPDIAAQARFTKQAEERQMLQFFTEDDAKRKAKKSHWGLAA